MRHILLSCLVLSCCADPEVDAPPAEERIGLKEYTLCDGSEDVRLAISQGGGFVAESTVFTGNGRFLRVNGKCDFVAALGGEDRGWVRGKLTADQARELEQQMHFSELEALVYRDVMSCPDAGGTSIATLHGYADCTCGCDEGTPRSVADAMIAMETAFASARTSGTRVRDQLEVIAVEQSFDGSVQGGSWPFIFAITEIAITDAQLVAHDFARARTLEGTEAELARALRDAAQLWEPAGRYLVDGKLYGLLVREKMPSAFDKAGNPLPGTGALEVCDAKEVVEGVTFQAPAWLRDNHLYATSISEVPCGARLCRDDGFLESNPVQLNVRVQRGLESRNCAGDKTGHFAADLAPLINAYKAQYGEPVRFTLNGLGTPVSYP
jgi:hypothetical protein